ncbi:MAG TPA: alkaline phosphatase family protein, partial [Acetobacteraceae bacterium]|nr:alkaline phosphatase family protein [Acetobacteraceae bacterium]
TGGISVDAMGHETVNPALASALTNADNIVGNLVQTLVNNGEAGNTQIILTAKHGQDPRLGAATLIAASTLTDDLAKAGFEIAQATQDDVALLWLADQSQAPALKTFLANYAKTHPEIKAIVDGSNFGAPATDNRAPDLIVQLNQGFIYVGNTANTRKRAEHGNIYNIDDTGVPLILWGGLDPSRYGLQINALVNTTQIAPTILNDLGLDYTALDGVRLEGTQLLPTDVPEPASFALLAAAVGGIGLARRKRR